VGINGMNRKLVFQILIATILIIGCSRALVNINTNKPVDNNKVTLGSTKYVKNIKRVSKKLGYKAALEKIISDVDKRESELDYNSPKNLSRFHILIKELTILEINSIGSQKH
jgi:hypothetical protein